jgi:hypothetical protein
MSNRFHPKYHRSNHHTDTAKTNLDGSPKNPDTGHDPIASREHPFLGIFSLNGGLSAIVSDTNENKSAGIFIARKSIEDACRFYGSVKLSGDFIMQDDLIHADIDTHKVGININPSTYTNYDLIVNKNLFVIENTNTKTLSADFVRINTQGEYDTYPLNVLNAINGDTKFIINKTGNVGVNLGVTPTFEDKDFKVIGDVLFDSTNKYFEVKGSTRINDSISTYTTKIGTHINSGQVSLGRNEIIKLTTDNNLQATCDIISTKNIYLSGNQDIKGNLKVRGNLDVLGDTTQLDTYVYVTSSVDITNQGTTTALVVTQTGATDIANFKDETGTVLFVDNDRRVGVLTDDPQYTLDVYGTIHTTDGLRVNGNKEIILGLDNENSVFDGTSFRHQYISELNSRFILKTQNDGTEPIAFRQSTTNNETNRLVIGSDGRVGINSSLTAIETFPAELTVYGSVSASQNLFINGTSVFSVSSNNDAVRITQTGNGNALRVEDSTNPDTTSFVINSDGRVGIGIDSPSTKLEISDSSTGGSTTWQGGTDFLKLFANNNNFSEQAIAFQETGTNVGGKIGVKNVGNGAYEIIFANRDNSSSTSTLTEKLRITNNGNVGIGTTLPGERLTISGNISASGNATVGGGTINIGDTGNLYLASASTLKTDDNLDVVGNLSTGGTLTINADTNLYRGAANVLKTDDSLEVTGTIFFSDGSASAPAIANTNDTNNGIFFPATDTLAFTTNGNERFRLDDGGGIWKYQAIPSSTKSQANSATALTLQEIQSGIIACTGSTVSHSLLLPTATTLNTNSPPINSGIEFSVINVNSSAAVSLAQNTGLSIGGIGGSVTVAANTSARFTLIKANNTPIFALYRLS